MNKKYILPLILLSVVCTFSLIHDADAGSCPDGSSPTTALCGGIVCGEFCSGTGGGSGTGAAPYYNISSVGITSASSVKDSSGKSINNKTITVEIDEMPFIATFSHKLTATLTQYIGSQTIKKNATSYLEGRTYDEISTKTNGVTIATKTNPELDKYVYTENVSIEATSGESKKVCQKALFSPTTITMNNGEILKTSGEGNSEACVTIVTSGSRIDVSSVSDVRDVTGKSVKNNIIQLNPGEDSYTATFSHLASSNPSGYENNIKYSYSTTTVNDSILSTKSSIDSNTYSETITVSVSAGESKKICQKVIYSPDYFYANSKKEIIKTVGDNFSEACVTVHGPVATDYFVPGTDIDN